MNEATKFLIAALVFLTGATLAVFLFKYYLAKWPTAYGFKALIIAAAIGFSAMFKTYRLHRLHPMLWSLTISP